MDIENKVSKKSKNKKKHSATESEDGIEKKDKESSDEFVKLKKSHKNKKKHKKSHKKKKHKSKNCSSSECSDMEKETVEQKEHIKGLNSDSKMKNEDSSNVTDEPVKKKAKLVDDNFADVQKLDKKNDKNGFKLDSKEKDKDRKQFYRSTKKKDSDVESKEGSIEFIKEEVKDDVVTLSDSETILDVSDEILMKRLNKARQRMNDELSNKSSKQHVSTLFTETENVLNKNCGINVLVKNVEDTVSKSNCKQESAADNNMDLNSICLPDEQSRNHALTDDKIISEGNTLGTSFTPQEPQLTAVTTVPLQIQMAVTSLLQTQPTFSTVAVLSEQTESLPSTVSIKQAESINNTASELKPATSSLPASLPIKRTNFFNIKISETSAAIISSGVKLGGEEKSSNDTKGIF
ncbi:hypothetical protein HELRODRAFT_171676 [Helobdella robusta]|uniref:Uncharacterized protein n=1 Tax=Helobdella robusta TaxID=6412 RepID=T1F4J3_HELRO|nr:hypothetical protein HELRODRAFT_171676 [Helobdella robusta]ESO05308.1 hypothetical protein HELRODRAFT_171676 [Helobdella robusta]